MTASPTTPTAAMATAAVLIICLLSPSSSAEPTAVSVSGSTPAIYECPSPRLLSFLPRSSSSTCTKQSQSTSSSSQLGDHRRSPSATTRFFRSLDTDRSGVISTDELSHFLHSRIGGSQLLDREAARNEAASVMNALDVDRDNGLEFEDVEIYWSERLDGLMTCREASEWVVHAVQLPNEVGTLFSENGITGYDFPEIVQNSGRVLTEELGLRGSFVTKIVRAVQARMLGIGSVPTGIADVEVAALTNCRSVGLKWSKSTARIFPVHSYRIQRRAVNLFESNNNSDSVRDSQDHRSAPSSSLDADGTRSSASLQSSYTSNNNNSAPDTAWKTMYEGGETEYVDSTLEMGHIYTYRIQAWNSAGRSPWEYVELEKLLKKKGCSTTRSTKNQRKERKMTTANSIVTMRGIDFGGNSHHDHDDDDDESWEWLSTPKRILYTVVIAVQFVYHSARAFFMVIAAGGAVMRFKRASATSSASAAAALPFPRFWKGLNRLSVKLTGHEIIPPSMLGDAEARLRQEQMHDDHVGATGLRGYATRNQVNGGGGITNSEVARSNNLRRDNSNLASTNSTNSLNSLSVGPLKPPSEVTVAKKSITKRKFGFRFSSGKKSNSSGALIAVENELTSPTSANRRTLSQESVNTQFRTSQQTHPPLTQSQPLIDDGTVCIACQQKFKIGKRYRHYCSRCMSTFCHKHGKTTHSNLTSCRVPGSCLCNPCLEEVLRKNSSISVT